MRINFSPVILLFALSLVVACSNSGMDKLDGKWVVDRDALIEMVRSERQTASLQDGPMFTQFLDILVDEFVLDFDTNKQELWRTFDRENGEATKYTVVYESRKEIKIKVDGVISALIMTGKDSFSIQDEGDSGGLPMIRAKE